MTNFFAYTLARKDYIHTFLFSELISREITFQLQEIFFGNSFPEDYISRPALSGGMDWWRME